MSTRKKAPDFRMTNEHRGKIKNSSILNALIEHVEGRREMSSTQVTAGLGLLKKVMPDLSSVDMTATVNNKRDAADWTREELLAIANAANGGKRVSDEDRRDRTTDSVH